MGDQRWDGGDGTRGSFNVKHRKATHQKQQITGGTEGKGGNGNGAERQSVGLVRAKLLGNGAVQLVSTSPSTVTRALGGYPNAPAWRTKSRGSDAKAPAGTWDHDLLAAKARSQVLAKGGEDSHVIDIC